MFWNFLQCSYLRMFSFKYPSRLCHSGYVLREILKICSLKIKWEECCAIVAWYGEDWCKMIIKQQKRYWRFNPLTWLDWREGIYDGRDAMVAIYELSHSILILVDMLWLTRNGWFLHVPKNLWRSWKYVSLACTGAFIFL